jgi:hypothetical protein
MVLVVGETTKGLAEGKIPDQIEGGEIIPASHVNDWVLTSAHNTGEFVNEHISVDMENLILFLECLVRERMGE